MPLLTLARAAADSGARRACENRFESWEVEELESRQAKAQGPAPRRRAHVRARANRRAAHGRLGTLLALGARLSVEVRAETRRRPAHPARAPKARGRARRLFGRVARGASLSRS